MDQVRSHKTEFWLTIFLSLGASSIWSVISLLRKLQATGGLAASTTTINRPMAETPWLDLMSQLVSIGLALIPVFLALYFLRQDQIRFSLLPNPKDLVQIVLVAAAIGIPGIGLYFLALNLGLTSAVVPSALNDNWWTVPILLLAAAKAGLLEEVVVVGFFSEKLRLINPRISVWVVVLLSALFRASYHLYQGYSAFIGNFVMGLVFALWYQRTKRVAPLIATHFLMDATVFVGYPLVFGS